MNGANYLLVFVLSILVAMVTNAALPKVQASSFGVKYGVTYPGKTLLLAGVIFLGIVVSAFALGVVDQKPKL